MSVGLVTVTTGFLTVTTGLSYRNCNLARPLIRTFGGDVDASLAVARSRRGLGKAAGGPFDERRLANNLKHLLKLANPFRGKVEKKGGVFRGPEREKHGSPWDCSRSQGVGAGKEEAIDAPPLKAVGITDALPFKAVEKMFLFLLLVEGANKRQGILCSSYPLVVTFEKRQGILKIPSSTELSSPAVPPCRGKVEKKGGGV
jgi:hypothetical protein